MTWHLKICASNYYYYYLNLLSASVAKNQHFRPCRKNLCVGSKKMIDPCRKGTMSSITMLSLGEMNYMRRL